MKSSRSDIQQKVHALPELRFEDQQLTSFSGLIVFHKLFEQLGLKSRLRDCFRHWSATPIFGPWRVVLLLVVHLLLGYRELRHLKYYADDPLVLRLLGVTQLPSVSTVSRTLATMDAVSVAQLQRLVSNGVLARLKQIDPQRVTLDFDGSVIGTSRYAEGSAVGFNRKKKGQRSYYPLFCTVAQTGQVLATLHRSGNVHDANGAKAFIAQCAELVRSNLPGVTLEIRMDSAFFSDEMVFMLEQQNIEYTISTPFERFVELKQRIEAEQGWQRLDADSEYIEIQWKPKSWQQTHRFILVRRRSKIQHKQPIQLDLFIPYEYGHEFKVVLTNKPLTPARVVAFHNGRGSQEGMFAELKTQTQMDYVPTRTWKGNQVYLLAAVLAHNLTRELYMRVNDPVRTTQPKRPALWDFQQLDTLRKRIVQRAGRLIRPQGKLTLSMSANAAVEKELLHALDALGDVA